jgi:hypothetical protein
MPQDTGSGTRFVGRAGELAELHAAYQAAAAGDTRLVLVAGEPGIGKTELVREFSGQAREHGALVLWGSAWEDGGAPPYWPWVQVLRGYARQAGPAALGEMAGRDGALLGQLLPELTQDRQPAGPPAAGEEARFALFEAVGAALDRASRTAPLVVVVDDLHAAGRPSALLLRFAATSPLSRVLFIATYRDAEARLDISLNDIITGLESAATVLSLGGLAPDEVSALLPGADAGVLAAVQRRGEGNPLFVAQVARMLGRRAPTVDEVPVPSGIRQAIRRQLADLDAGAAGSGDAGPAHELLATASAIGLSFDPALVAAALDTAPEVAARQCDLAAAAGLLQPGPDSPGSYRFGHALIRETLYTGLAPQARAETHRRIAAVLEAEPWRARSSHAELAHHFLRGAAASGPDAARAVAYAGLAGEDALNALAYEEAAGYFRQALETLARAPESAPAQRCELQLRLATALLRGGQNPAAQPVIDDAAALARQAGLPRLLAAAALARAQELDFNAPADTTVALLREAAERLDPEDRVLRARLLARLAIALSARRADAQALAEQAVRLAEQAREPGDGDAAVALAAALAARQHVLWGTQEPADALDGATQIVAAAQRAREPDTERDGRVLCLTHLLELGDGPAAQRVLPELDRLAESTRHPTTRLVALSRRSTLTALTGDFTQADHSARQAWQAGTAAGLPDADAVYWGQLFAIWLHTDLAGRDEQWMETVLRGLVARSQLSAAHAAALTQIETRQGATEQARGRLDDLVTSGLDLLRPDMMYVWALAQLAQACCGLGAAQHADRLYGALAPYAGRAVVAAGAVMCAGAADHYLAELAALAGRPGPAARHYLVAIRCHRGLGARPMLARSLHGYARLRGQDGGPDRDAAAALAEARAIAAECGMTRLLADLDEPDGPAAPDAVRLRRDGDLWLLTHGPDQVRMPDSLGLRYLDLLVSNPGTELTALNLVQLAGATGAAPGAPAGGSPDGLHEVTMAGDEVLDAQARAAYRSRLAAIDEELTEAEDWHDGERASRLRAERDFLVQEITAAAGLAGRTRRLGSESERARVNVTRALRTAIARIRDRAPGAADYLDRTIRTGTRCSYRPPGAP